MPAATSLAKSTYFQNSLLSLSLILGSCSALLWVRALPAQQLTADQQAEMLLTGARKAYNEKNYPFAVARFREFLARFGNHKEAPSARYQLGLSLLEIPERDYTGAVEQLQAIAGNKDLPEHALVLYHLGLAKRGLGTRELAQAEAKPPEAPQRRAAANRLFEEAATQFAAAATAFKARAKPLPENAKELPPDQEWLARSVCDQAEMQLRTNKIKEAQASAEPFLKDPLAKSRYQGLGLYYHGFASFLLRDYQMAGRSLNQPGALADPVVGIHARYLLARTYHLGDERNKAALHYEGVLTDYDKQKQAAAQALQRPDQFKNDLEEKARLEALVKNPPPDYVGRAAFGLGVLLYEGGRFADALTRFTQFAQQHPTSSLLSDDLLRQGFCLVQLKQYAEAVKILQPLADKEPRLADQALLWLGKAQVGATDPANAAAYDQALKVGLDTFRRAADRAQQLAGTDPEAKGRRGEILLELADTQQLAKQFKDAAVTYGQILNEKSLPQHDEETLQRQATALHLAGDYNGSDQVCLRFRDQYSKSTLLPAVLFRYAENAYFSAVAAEKIPDAATRAREVGRFQDEALKRYQVVVEKYPEFVYVNLARYGVALILYRKGELENAQQMLEKIPQAERHDDLAQVPYLLADCLIRLAPTKIENALDAGRLEERLKGAIEQLDAFVGAQPASPQAPDALLKLGLCHQRLASLLVQPQEKAPVLGNARATYERLIQQFPKHPLMPQAVFERAKCIAQAGDVNGAINELRRFTNDPALQAAPVGPMAVLQLATLLRGQNKAAEAADALAKARPQMEPAMLRDPARADWVPLLQYHQGIALREAGKLPEARAVFDAMIAQFPGRPEAAEAALRRGQCLKDEGLQKLDAAQKRLAAGNLKPEELAQVNRTRDEGYKAISDAVQYLHGQAEQLKQKQPVPEARARMLYEAAWGYRTLAEPEVAAARAKIQEELKKKLLEEAIKKSPTGKPPAVIAAPDVPLAQVPLQPSQTNARAEYLALVTSFPDLPLSVDARFELAELHAERAEYDAALKLLTEALDKEPAGELADKIIIQMGVCHAAKKDLKSALDQFDRVAQNVKSPLAGQAHYRAGECLMQQKDWAKAAARLVVFRDQAPFQNLPGVSDKALLRLGHAYAELKQWDQSRQAHELVVARFGNSPWVNEARYGMAWAFQNKAEYDNAVNVYTQVTAATATEIGAKAQLQIGLCRLEQKRYAEATTALLVVPFTYDYPDLSAAALCEAARGFAEMKQHKQAEVLWLRVIKDHPHSEWAGVAKKRLEALGAMKNG
jgi:TolA-binding protein